MRSTTMTDRLERTSRVSAILMALGALVVLAALWLTSNQLRTLRVEVQSLESTAIKLKTQNEELRAEARSLESDAIVLRADNKELRTTSDGMRIEIQGLREALTASRDAIIAFHQRDYGTAVQLYDQALRADPNNAYLLNLKAYSLFKLKRISDAMEVQKLSIRINPHYAWGYFDLARFQCAAGDYNEARQSMEKAIEERPELRSTMDKDGEFRKLCAPILR